MRSDPDPGILARSDSRAAMLKGPVEHTTVMQLWDLLSRIFRRRHQGHLVLVKSGTGPSKNPPQEGAPDQGDTSALKGP